ncbi:MAG: SNF2-related protein [Sciscionella sp.]
MGREVRLDVHPGAVEEIVGPAAYQRAVSYVDAGAVIQALWKPEAGTLIGTVRGSGGRVYTTTAYFAPGVDTRVLTEGECSCPVGIDCKHVAALALSVAPVPSGGHRRRTSWDNCVGSMQGQGECGEVDTPLAIELGLAASTVPNRYRADPSAPATPKLNARLVRPGRRSGWAGGDLSWTRLGSLRYHGSYHDAQVRLLEQLYAMYCYQGANPASYNSYRDEKTIDLTAFPSHQLWPLLDEARALGVRLVYARGKNGTVEHYSHAELCLDVTRAEGSRALVVAPALRIGESGGDVVPLAFIGVDGHGVVYGDRAAVEDNRDPSAVPFRLARLAKEAPAALQRMVLERKTVEIPTADSERFRDEFYPRLRHLATVTSSDDSFTPPEISEPTLVLRADYQDNHDLDLRWEWSYRIGDSELRTPLTTAGDNSGFRDRAAERAVLSRLDVPLEKYGLRSASPDPASRERAITPAAQLGGIDTMRFTTELLPLLSDAPEATVEVSGTPADYREAGDSLRIGVSADESEDGGHDWFDLGITVTLEGREVPFSLLFSALAQDHSYLLLPDGAYFSLLKPKLRSLHRVIEEARALRDAPSGALKISRFQAGLWEELAALGVVDRQAAAWQRQVEGLLSLDTLHAPALPPGLSAQLRPYQADGFAWLTFLWQHGLGGILADDMGLGKTLQSLALISHARRGNPCAAPFLIVAPASVVANWASESARFTPDLNVVAATETVRRSGRPLGESIAGADMVVTSYTLFRLDFEHYADMDCSGLILDEAQFAKNHQSQVYWCARELDAPFKLAITGTPMENNLMELWSILSITAPGLFPNPHRFKEYFARPIERHGDPELLARLRRRVKPLVKRRTKEQVAADLPEKQEQVLEVELHPEHRTLYQRHLQRERQKVLGLLDDMNGNRFTILRSLTLLRRLSLHAGLVDDEHRNLPCAKIDALFEQLEDVLGSEHRALVFSQFTGFLDQVRARLDAKGIAYCYLDGKTRNRPKVIERFKSGDAPLFLISLKAGGFGLNLTEADYCFLLDPWWNPATEKQAVDRTHRIGQSRNVVVYRMIAKDTIEEKVMALQQRKAALFASVMDDGNAFGTALGAEDIKELLA